MTMHANARSLRLKRIVSIVLVSASTASGVSAQTNREAQSDLETVLTPGMTVWITEASGVEEKTRIVDVDDTAVTTTAGEEVRHFRAADIRRVRVRHSDTVLNGALIGAGVAIASGLAVCRMTEPWENCRDDVGPMIRIGALGAGIGIGIDALIRGRKTIYDGAEGSTRLHVAPIVGRHARGLQVSVGF